MNLCARTILSYYRHFFRFSHYLRRGSVAFSVMTLLLSGLITIFPLTAQPEEEVNRSPASSTVLPVQGLTLSEALRIADENNLQLQAAQKNIDLSRWDIRIAKEIPNPQVSSNNSAGKITSVLSNPQQIGVTETFETAGKRRKRTDVARSQSVLSMFQYNALRWDTRSQVRKAYAELIGAEASANALDNQAMLLDRLVDIAGKRFRAGVAPKSELMQAELSRLQLSTQRTQILSKIEQDRYQLNSLLGNHLSPQFEVTDKGLFKITVQKTEVVPPPENSLPDKGILFGKALEQRLDLKAAVQQKDVSQHQLRLVKAQRIPDLQLSAGYLYVTAPQPGGRKYYDGPFFGAAVNVPLFHNQGAEIGKTKTTIAQNELQIRDLQRQIRLDVDTAYSALQASRQNIEMFEIQLLPSAKDVLRVAQRSYQVGKTPLANVILAQQSFQQVISSYLDAVVAYQTAWGDLERAVGAPLETW